ncbi:MAG: hypothetical protein PHN49_12465, partial [Candidatus Omnitrophica bacterium]|nr:hypothetical protein [Candidatus Omnitrophota bacterium]
GKTLTARFVFNTREEITSAAITVRAVNGSILFDRKITQVAQPRRETGTGLLMSLAGKLSAYSGVSLTLTRSDIQIAVWVSIKAGAQEAAKARSSLALTMAMNAGAVTKIG